MIIHPVPESELKNLAKELLGLAKVATDVEYVMWPEPGFRVPDYLAEAFVAGRSEVPAPEVVPSPEVAEDKEDVEPVRRKPGRPKKEAQ